MVRTWAFLGVFAVSGLVFGCGGGDGSGQSQSLSIAFELFKGGMNVPCASVSEVQSVRVTLLTEDGLTVRAGFPRDADCETGRFTAVGLADGKYVLDVAARGPLGEDPAAVLFHARTPLTLPDDAQLMLSLAPEVAYLELGWTFGDRGLGPCATEVDTIDVLISSGNTQSGGFQGTFACDAGPVALPSPFDLQEYTIKVEAYSSDGLLQYTATERRLLDRGPNAFTAILSPLGGRLYFDWQFGIGATIIRSCDDPRVMAGDLRFIIRSLEGGSGFDITVPCAQTRPFALPGLRYTQGRRLELEMISDAVERFRHIERFTMPSGDRFSDAVTMHAVGTATVSIEVTTSSCSDPNVDGFDVEIYTTDARNPELVFSANLPRPQNRAAIPNLRYRDYRVHVSQSTPNGPLCPQSGIRTIDDRDNDWEGFRL